MGRVIVSVDIEAPPENVFSLIKNTEQVVSLMPPGWKVDAYKVTEGDIGVGTEYDIKIKSRWLKIAYRDKVEEVVDNKKIRSRSVEGFNYTNLAWLVEAKNNETRLIRQAEFRLPYSVFGWVIEKLVADWMFKRVGEQWLRNIKANLEAK